MSEREGVDTVLHEGQKFLDDTLAHLGLPNDSLFGAYVDTDKNGKAPPRIRRSQDVGRAITLTALAWGMLKAIYECPNCPGHYRVPMEPVEEGWRQIPYQDERASDDSTWEAIACPHCQGLWTRKHEPGKAEQLALF